MMSKTIVFGYYEVSKELQAEFNCSSIIDVLGELSSRTWLVWDEPDNLEDRILILRAKDEDDEGRVAELIGLLFNVLGIAMSGDIEGSFEFKKKGLGASA